MLRRWYSKLFPGPAPSAAGVNEKGIAVWQSGDLPAAETLFREALGLDPFHAPSSSNLGMVLFLSLIHI
jgi:Flp pilus assembly protein TadD